MWSGLDAGSRPRYRRRLVDAAITGAQVLIDLLVRRFPCPAKDCPAVTFTEQVEGLTSPHSRYTLLARRMCEAIGLALAGRAGARLATQLGITVGRDTLLTRVRRLADPEVGAAGTCMARSWWTWPPIGRWTYSTAATPIRSPPG
ncbi:hypothetical protein Franean1_7029 [Parafrankia sp. EAN1pec]|nr:hypothetical protein Franean1_7029 [Frankia sp. EAN1pec]